MKQSIFFRYRNYILIAVLIVIVIISALYLLNDEGQSYTETPQVAPEKSITTTPIASSISPQSPMSPFSPILNDSPQTPEQGIQDEMFETGLQFYEQGNYVKAKETFNKILEINPDSARTYDARGTVYFALGNPENALNDYAKAIEIDPLFPPPYYNRGRLYSQQKNYERALSDLQKSVEVAPSFFGYRANGNIGLIYHQMGEYDKALEAFNESMSYDDGKADVFYLRGETHTALEDYNAAITDYQAAIERFSRYDKASQSLGYAYYKTGQLDQAMEALNQATTVSPTSPTAHLYKMLVYLAMSDIRNAQSEANQGMNSISQLSEDDQQFLLSRVLADLNSFTEANQIAEAKELIKLIETQSP
jgi:tetratricopeptide (TPR) repeat protein